MTRETEVGLRHGASLLLIGLTALVVMALWNLTMAAFLSQPTCSFNSALAKVLLSGLVWNQFSIYTQNRVMRIIFIGYSILIPYACLALDIFLRRFPLC